MIGEELDRALGAQLDEYLANLLICGNKRKSVQSAGLQYAQIKAYCEHDPDFAEREKEALLTRSARIVETIEEQALHGIREYVVNKKGEQIFIVNEEGKQIPLVRTKPPEQSVRLAMLKRHGKAYRDLDRPAEKAQEAKHGVLVMPQADSLDQWQERMSGKDSKDE